MLPDEPPTAALADLTWPEAAGRFADPATVAVLPVASTEQHGHHLPIGTDTLLAEAMLVEGRRRMPTRIPLIVLPTLTYGKSNEHAGFAGTLSLRAGTLRRVLRDVAEGVWTAGGRRLVLFNTHGGNHATLAAFARDARARKPALAVWNLHAWDLLTPEDVPPADPADLHAGARETSLMLAVAPERVRLAVLAGRDPAATRAVEERVARLLRHGFAWLTSDLATDGTIGAAELGDEGTGRTLLQALGIRLAEALTAFAELDWPA